MKSLIVLAVLALLIIPSLAFADGMPFPRPQQKTFDFTSVKEKQQYASIEVMSNYFEKMNLFLSLTSLDYENHNITVVIPLKSVPQDVNGEKMNSTEFLNKYSFGNVEKMIELQSGAGLVKKSAPQVRDVLGEYIMLSLISPLYEISKLAFIPFYSTFAGASALVTDATKISESYPGVTHIATYQFEGATVDIYNVESGDTLGDFLVDYYDLVLPDNVREAVDIYKNHYIAVLNAMVGPPSDVSLFKQYAPETFKDALKYVRTNPEFKFSCYNYNYGYYTKTYPYYTSCTEEGIIRQKFSDFITRANNEASLSGIPIQQAPTLIQNSGFEQGESFWQDYGGYQYSRTYNTGHSVDRSNYRSGSSSLYVYDRSSSEWIGICQQFQVTPGRTYTASAWARVQEGNVGFWLTTNYPSTSSSLGECYSSADYISSTSWRSYTTTCTPRYSKTMYVCLGTRSSYITGSGWFDDISIYSQYSNTGVMDNSVINFFLNAYSNSTKGMELSMTLPLKNSEISYPLGTGVAWSTPIEDTKILVKMDKSLDVSFANVQNSAIDNNNRYYLWSYKNWNPDFDIKGTVAPSGFPTMLGDTGKMILQTLNENSLAFSIFIMIIIIIIAALIVRFKGRGDKKRKTFFLLLTVLIAPFISIWAVILLAYGLKTKPNKEEMKENFMNSLIFLGILILAWIFMGVISIIIGV